MKKRISVLIAIALLAVITSTLLVACNNTEYSVTVLSPDGNGMSDITVSWLNGNKVAGSAKTDADGVATTRLTAGMYSVSIEGFGENLDYTPISVTASMPEIRISLRVKLVTYTVTVKDKNGANAAGVTVSWMNGNSLAGTATTDANGKATKELDYNQYTIALNNLPSGNIYDGAKTVTGSEPSVEITLSSGISKRYSVVVKSEGGLIFKNQSVSVYVKDSDVALIIGSTNDEGEFSFTAREAEYTIEATKLPDGYTQAQVNLSPENAEGEIVLHSEIITAEPNANTTYVIGDIFHDYTFTTPYTLENGKPWSSSIAKILKTKQAIIINNWGKNCSWCMTEMPDMQEAYEKYSDKIEIIALNNFSHVPDSNTDICNYQQSNPITFPMMRDTYGLSVKLALTNWPTTVIIDRYGAIARIEVGAVLGAEAWERMILKYIGDDYVQTFTPGDRVSESINNEIAKPDVEVPEDHYTTQVPGTLHNTATFPANTTITWRGETENEYAWPFLIGENSNISDTQYLYASNINKPNTMAVIYADITVNAGDVLAFEYYADSEEKDILNFVWDGKIIHRLSGPNNGKGWQTCYLYSELTDGDHTLAIAYTKNSSGDVGKDNVYIRNIHFVSIESIEAANESVDMLRGAAYGQLNVGDTQFPHYAEVYLDQNDGYYHVRLSSLQNAQLAGTDEDPLLLVNLLNVTTWSPMLSLNQLILGADEGGNYICDCRFALSDGVVRDYRGELTRYLSAASASDIEDMAPVNQHLHDMLVEFMKKLSGQDWHDREWLEVCFYYSHYGAGDPVGNPIMGLMTETAITLEQDTVTTANLTRIMMPFPTVIYAFTPTESGLYKLESFIQNKDAEQYSAQIWLYDDETDPDHALAYSGDRLTIDARNEQNFELYYNMTAGHKYYIEVAFTMNEMGTYDFNITRVNQDISRWEPASADYYEMVLDSNGEITSELVLADAVNYELYTDGYYRVKNADGSWGDYIYLDVLRVKTSALGEIPLTRLVAMEAQDPVDYRIGLGYNFFDFTYCIMYYEYQVGDNTYVGYRPKVDIHLNGERYKDYTEILQRYINDAPTEGEYQGLIKVNKEIADILNMFFEMRINAIWAEVANNGTGNIESYKIEAALENEWLRFCWYSKTYKAENE